MLLFSQSASGPGAVFSGATVFGGLQSYSGAYAAVSGKAVNLQRVSDSATADFNFLTDGSFDIASANTFAGVDATATASATSSTTLNLTGASSTPHVGSTIAAAPNQPCYVVSVGSFSGGAGTIVVNQAQTMVALSISLQYGLAVAKIYDQTGNGNDLTPVSTLPWLYPSAINGLPAIDANFPMRVTLGVSVNQPLTYFIVAERYGQFTSSDTLLGTAALFAYLGVDNAVDTWYGYAGTQVNFTVSDSVAHAVSVVMNGASGAVNIDGTDTTALNFGASAQGTAFDLGPANAYAGCFGLWPSAASPTQRDDLHALASPFWLTP